MTIKYVPAIVLEKRKKLLYSKMSIAGINTLLKKNRITYVTIIDRKDGSKGWGFGTAGNTYGEYLISTNRKGLTYPKA